MLYGAKWWKIDFHLHTPASEDFKEPLLTYREYLLSAMQNGLDCIVVTDHNCCNWVDGLRTELKLMQEERPEGYRDLIIFPGVEIEVFPSIHLLAIFDPQKNVADIKNIIAHILGAGSPQTFQDAIKIIQRSDGIALPAHIDNIKGLFHEIKGTSLKTVLDNCDFFAIEVVNPEYELPQLCIDMKREYTYVMGSDAHTKSNIGHRFSWVKMETPNIKSLALALQDGEDGVISNGTSINNPNSIENRFHIEGLTVTKGQKIGNGKSFSVHFSPWLNTIIGGRGSGKTAITEFMRIILNKVQNLPKEIEATHNKFAKIPSTRTDVGMLRPDTKIEVIILKDARRLKLIWESNKWSEYYQENNTWIPSESVGDINQRFPIQIYSQKQLYEMAEEPNCLIHYIDNLFDFNSWKQQLHNLNESYILICRQEREIIGKISQEPSLRAQLSDLDAKIRMIESATHSPIISILKKYSSKYTEFESELTTIKSTLTVMQKNSIQATSVSKNIFDNILDSKYAEKYNFFISEWNILIKDYIVLQGRITSLNELADELYMHRSHYLSTDFKDAKTQYSQTISNLRQQGINNITNLDYLYEQRKELQDKIDNIDRLKSQLQDISERKSAQFNDIIIHQQKLRDKRNRIIARLNSDQVRITLLPMQDHLLAEEEFRDIIRKDTQFQSDIYDPDNIDNSFIGQLCCSDTIDMWEKRLETISNLLDTEFRRKHYGKRFNRYIDELCNEHPEDIDALSIWVPPDAIQIEIQMNGRFSNIAQGSAGQKTTALLSLILRSNTGPLIIDQPEDDLDTKLISEMLVKELRNQKERNQVIVVTHNPNIPVNGAAEQILAMDFAYGQITCKFEGALQNQFIRNEICDVMEGGRDALKKRYFRIYKPLYQ